MPLKRKPSILVQIRSFFFGMAFIAAQAFVVWRVVHSGNAGLLGSPYLALGLIYWPILQQLDVMLLYSPINGAKRSRAMQSAVAGEDALAPPWRFPLDPALALPAGKTLTLVRPTATLGPGQVIALAILSPILLLLFAACGEALILPAFPSLGNWLAELPSNLHSIATPPTLDPLDWAALAFPVVLTLGFGILVIISYWRDGNLRIIADDAGITLRTRLRNESIPWHDIVVCLKAGVRKSRGINGIYQLRGRDHALDFAIFTPQILNATNTPSSAAHTAIFAQYQPYIDDAKILLATLIARSGVTIRTINLGKNTSQMKGSAAFMALSAEEINKFPLAINQPAAVTPDLHTTLHALTHLILKRRAPFWRLLPGALFLGLLISAFMYGISIRIAAPDFNMKPADMASTPILVLFGLIFLSFSVFGYTMASSNWRRKEPIVIATARDITANAQDSKFTTTMWWEDVRAWAVHLPRDPARMPTRYVIATELHTLTWVEQPNAKLIGRTVRGDRRAAYRTMAEQVHALIAAKTNLPLHEIITPSTT